MIDFPGLLLVGVCSQKGPKSSTFKAKPLNLQDESLWSSFPDYRSSVYALKKTRLSRLWHKINAVKTEQEIVLLHPNVHPSGKTA